MAEEIIKTTIQADGSQAINEVDKVDKKILGLGDNIKSLEKNFKDVAKVSGAVFATLTGSIFANIAAYRQQEQAEKQLQNVLTATGKAANITVAEMQALASAFQNVTTYGDESIMMAQTMLLQFKSIGKDVMPQATEATLDLATRLGVDLNSAARMLGKALEDPTKGMRTLKEAGVVLSENQLDLLKNLQATGKTAEAQKMVFELLAKSVGGAARATGDGTGVFIQIKNIFGDISEEVGKRLLPSFVGIAEKIKAFAILIQNNPAILDAITKFTLWGTAISGVVLGLSLLGLAIPKAIALIAGLKAAVLLLAGSIKAALITSGIGLLVVALGALVYYWKESFSAIQSVYSAVVGNIGRFTDSLVELITSGFSLILSRVFEISKAITELIKNIFTFDLDAIKASASRVGDIISESLTIDGTEFGNSLNNVKGILTDFKKEVASGYEGNMATFALGTPEQIASDAKNASNTIENGNNEIAAKNDAAREAELLKIEAHNQKILELEKTRLLGDEDAKRTVREQDLQSEIENNNLFLIEKARFGEAYARLSQIARSKEFQGAKTASAELMALQNSESKKMQAIGKAAAITNAVISTHEGAIKAYSALAGIPFVGPALGIAAAGALTAYGLERVRQIQAMATGGLVQGGSPYRDSVPAMLQEGELVVPRKNFDSVVESEARKIAGVPEQMGGGVMEFVIGFKDNAIEIIEEKLLERKSLGISGL